MTHDDDIDRDGQGGGEPDVLDRATGALRDVPVAPVAPALIARTQQRVRAAAGAAATSFNAADGFPAAAEADTPQPAPMRVPASPFRHPLLRVAAAVAVAAAGLALYAALRPDRAGTAPVAQRPANEPASPTLKPADPAPAPAFVADANARAVRGRVRFAGVAPKPAIMSMAANAHCAAHHRGEVIDESVLVNADGSLRNVVVWVSGGLEGKRFDPPGEPAVLDQQGCVFTPHVVTVMAGQRLMVKNSDPFVHNVRGAAANNPPFNFAQPTIDKGKPLVFNGPERMLVKCDIHPWMSAYVHVVDNPFFAVTGESGTFQLPDGLPPGRYTVSAWHEVYGDQRVEVAVEAGKPMPPLEFTFRPTQRADATKEVPRDCCDTAPPVGLVAMRG